MVKFNSGLSPELRLSTLSGRPDWAMAMSFRAM